MALITPTPNVGRHLRIDTPGLTRPADPAVGRHLRIDAALAPVVVGVGTHLRIDAVDFRPTDGWSVGSIRWGFTPSS